MKVLVLAGGGAKGAFQAGALKYLDQVQGYPYFDRVLGVSVGALNGAGYLTGGSWLLEKLWFDVRQKDVYKKYSWLRVVWRILWGARGLYDNSPLRRLLQKHIFSMNRVSEMLQEKLLVGYVDLMTGSYYSMPGTLNSVFASATMPVIWSPADKFLVDGGLRDVTPLGDALALNPDEITVILCSPPGIHVSPIPSDIMNVAKRSIEIAMQEIAENDISSFLRINDLVKQAGNNGVTLVKPTGEPYKYCKIRIIEPWRDTGDTLDFSPIAIKNRFEHGFHAAEMAFTTWQ